LRDDPVGEEFGERHAGLALPFGGLGGDGLKQGLDFFATGNGAGRVGLVRGGVHDWVGSGFKFLLTGRVWHGGGKVG
jgi:hypothetical protein